MQVLNAYSHPSVGVFDLRVYYELNEGKTKRRKKKNEPYIDIHYTLYIFEKKKTQKYMYFWFKLPTMYSKIDVSTINEPLKIQKESMKWWFSLSIDFCDQIVTNPKIEKKTIQH